MCGVAGFIDFKGELFSKEKRASFIGDSVKLLGRRGPDAHGVKHWELGNSHITFIHTRLSIIDLSVEANQPFLSEDSKFALLFNGELYNYIELRDQIDDGHIYRTRSDTEVLLQAYRHYGLDMFKQLEGMFAGAVFDIEDQKIHLFRDHIGIKPLYYYKDSRGVVFASEPKVIRKAIPSTNRVNKCQASTYMMFGISDYGAETFFEGIHQLEPGQMLNIDLSRQSCHLAKYYLPSEAVDAGRETTPKDYYELIMDVVKRQLRSDVQVGMSLSGGIDSGVIATCSGKLLGADASKLKALTYVAPGYKNDESDNARSIAYNAGLSWIPVEFNANNFEEDFTALVKYMEEPFGSLSIFAQFNIMKAAKAEGCKVMLDGQGGDELYIGYPRLAQRIIIENLRKGRLNSAFSEWYWAVKRQEMATIYPLLSNIYFNLFSLAKVKKMKLFSRYVNAEYLLAYDEEAMIDFFSAKSMKEKQVDELFRFILPRLLKYADRNSMFHSVESRVPHLAQRNVYYGLNVPIKDKIHQGWTKHIIRKAFENEMPKSVIWQTRKIGFDTPQGLWLNKIYSFIESEIDDLGGLISIQNVLEALKDPVKGQDHGLFRVLSFIFAVRSANLSF
jgi:asparagine synthase (glutamine-hydrolysing)